MTQMVLKTGSPVNFTLKVISGAVTRYATIPEEGKRRADMLIELSTDLDKSVKAATDLLFNLEATNSKEMAALTSLAEGALGGLYPGKYVAKMVYGDIDASNVNALVTKKSQIAPVVIKSLLANLEDFITPLDTKQSAWLLLSKGGVS